jgi:hypothetical protein
MVWYGRYVMYADVRRGLLERAEKAGDRWESDDRVRTVQYPNASEVVFGISDLAIQDSGPGTWDMGQAKRHRTALLKELGRLPFYE